MGTLELEFSLRSIRAGKSLRDDVIPEIAKYAVRSVHPATFGYDARPTQCGHHASGTSGNMPHARFGRRGICHLAAHHGRRRVPKGTDTKPATTAVDVRFPHLCRTRLKKPEKEWGGQPDSEIDRLRDCIQYTAIVRRLFLASPFPSGWGKTRFLARLSLPRGGSCVFLLLPVAVPSFVHRCL